MLSSRTLGWLPPKKGKGKLPIFCGNIERVIPIYCDGGGMGGGWTGCGASIWWKTSLFPFPRWVLFNTWSIIVSVLCSTRPPPPPPHPIALYCLVVFSSPKCLSWLLNIDTFLEVEGLMEKNREQDKEHQGDSNPLK